MKQRFFSISFFVCIILSATAQRNQVTIKSTDEQVKLITEGLDDCDKKTTVADSSGWKTLYKCGEEKVVRIEVAQEKILKQVTWVYKNDLLIYADQIWTHEGGMVIDHEKFYLDGKELLAWIKTDGKFVDADSEEFIRSGKELIDFSQRLIME